MTQSRPLIHPHYRPDIDGLRALAVLAVVIYHAMPSLLPGGFIGVDIFFVISGYLITTIIFKSLQLGCFSFREFYTRRIKRIFPALGLVLLACYIAGWFSLAGDELEQLGKHIAGSAGFVLNLVLKNESGYFDNASITKPLLHLWSLAIEEQFYLCWPLVCWLGFHCRSKYGSARTCLMTLTVAALAYSFIQNIQEVYETQSHAYFLLKTRAWELLAGSLLGLGLSAPSASTVSIPMRRFAYGLSGLGVLLFALGVLLVNEHQRFPGWWALFPVLCAVCLIWAGDVSNVSNGSINPVQRFLANRYLVKIGLISYPLYLWHWPLLSFAHIYTGGTPPLMLRVGLIGVAFGLAWLTYHGLERRIRRVQISSNNMLRFGLIAGIGLLGGIGYLTYQQEGFSEFRYGTKALVKESGRYICVQPKHSVCTFGNAAAKKIVLLYGDSHADVLSKALQETLGDRYKFFYIANGSCFMGEKIVRIPGNVKDCLQAIERIKALRGIPIYATIKVQRWHAYIPSDQIQAAIEDSLTVYGLNPYKKIIVGPTADVALECEISNYYSRPFRFKKNCLPKEQNLDYNRLFVETTEHMHWEHVYFIYPFKRLCPKDKCIAINGRIAYYADDNHLSKAGALLVVHDIAQALDR